MSESFVTCPKCGNNNRAGAKFCRGCGSALATPPPAYAPAPPVHAPPIQPTAYAPAPEPVYPQPPYYEAAPPEAQPAQRGSCLGTMLALVFAGLFVLLVCFALPYSRAMKTLLKPDIYKEALAEEDFYNRLPALFVEQMDQSKPGTLTLEGVSCINVQDFNRADWQVISDVFLRPDWMQEQTESLMDQFFDFMQSDNDDDALSLHITAEYLKDLLTGDDGFALYKTIVETKPECSIMDMFAIGTWVTQPQSGCLKVCSPPIIQMDRNIWDIVTSFAGAIPTEYSLDNFLNMQPLEDLRPLYRLAETVRKASPLLILIAIPCLLLTLVSRRARSIQGVLLFWGLPLAIAGLLCLAAALLMPAAGAWVMSDAAVAGDLSSGVEELLVDITRNITGAVANDIAMPALALLAIGGLMSVGGVGWGIVRKLVKK